MGGKRAGRQADGHMLTVALAPSYNLVAMEVCVCWVPITPSDKHMGGLEYKSTGLSKKPRSARSSVNGRRRTFIRFSTPLVHSQDALHSVKTILLLKEVKYKQPTILYCMHCRRARMVRLSAGSLRTIYLLYCWRLMKLTVLSNTAASHTLRTKQYS